MNTPEDADHAKLRRRFPTARARWAADKAADALPETADMRAHIDEWLRAYRAAGGQEKTHKE